MSSSSGQRNLCSKCVIDKYFSDWINENGDVGKCDFNSEHKRKNKVTSIEVFAEEVDRYFRENYQKGGEYAYFPEGSDNHSYETYGDTYKNILSEDIQCEEDVLEAIVDNLPDISQRDYQQGAELFYDDCLNYEPIEEASRRDYEEAEDYWFKSEFKLQWKTFCETVQYKGRFLHNKEKLDELFGKVEEYEAGKIRPIYDLPEGTKVFRARILDAAFTPQVLQENPATELGAPPKEKVAAGRMNVELIPVLYAAFNQDTSIAEVRPSIGDNVAVGEFVLKRKIRVFDFTVFDRVYKDMEEEDRKECFEHTRYEFISELQDEISKPIQPHEKQKEYIPTQIVAEYIRDIFNCDAIIYKSSAHKNGNTTNRNIVFLNKEKEFVGEEDAAILAFMRHEIKEIANIVYETSEEMPF